jgi:hypothetical protein
LTQSRFVGTLPKEQNKFCTPFEVVSIGDHIDEGEYVVHSRFHKALNFVKHCGVENDKTSGFSGSSSDRLVSLVIEEVGAGPNNIIIQGLNFHTVHSLLITEQTLFINKCLIPLDKSKQYHSMIDFTTRTIEQVEKHLDLFEMFLLRLSPLKSLAFLLDKARSQYFHPGFERAVVERIQTGVYEIFHGNLFGGVKAIKGVGFGLTPSGDDFISGLLLGLFIIQNVYGKDFSEIREQVYRSAIGSNRISNTFLSCAREGLLFERWKFLLCSLLYAGENNLYEATQQLLSVGETSGADTVVGFLLTIKKWGQILATETQSTLS